MAAHGTNYRGLVLLVATTVVVAACGGGDKGSMAPPPAANTAPVVSDIPDKTSTQDTVVGPVDFRVADRESDASLLTVSATADGAAVVPADGLALAGSGAMRSITLTPLEAATGTVKVTLSVADPQGAISTRSFAVTVNARSASMRELSLTTFAKAESDDATTLNGYTYTQDADDPAIYEPLIGAEEE